MSADLRGYSYALRSKLAEGLSPSARHVAWVLLSYANADGWAWPKAATTLVQGTGYSRPRVMALLDELVKAGWVQRRSHKSAGAASEYLLTIPAHLTQETPDEVSRPQDTGVSPAGQGVSRPQDTISTRGTTKELPTIVGGGQGAAAPSSLPEKSKPKTPRHFEQGGDSGSPSKVKKSEVELRQEAMRTLEAIEAADPDGTSDLPAAALLAPHAPPRPRRSPADEAARKALLAAQIAKLQEEANP
jgi:hypothetical protein